MPVAESSSGPTVVDNAYLGVAALLDWGASKSNVVKGIESTVGIDPTVPLAPATYSAQVAADPTKYAPTGEAKQTTVDAIINSEKSGGDLPQAAAEDAEKKYGGPEGLASKAASMTADEIASGAKKAFLGVGIGVAVLLVGAIVLLVTLGPSLLRLWMGPAAPRSLR